jgi:hypothetical protein
MKSRRNFKEDLTKVQKTQRICYQHFVSYDLFTTITIGGKSDWFLPSKDELNEMYKERTHLGISSGYFWSSSQYNHDVAWYQSLASGSRYYGSGKDDNSYGCVRAVRAF